MFRRSAAICAAAVLAATLAPAPAGAAKPVKPAEGEYSFVAGGGKNVFRFSVEHGVNAKGKKAKGNRIARLSVYSACQRGIVPAFYADTFGFKIKKSGVVKINKTLTNKPISKDKITLKAKIRFTGEKKATGWYSITNHATCSKPDKKKVKRFKFSAQAG